MSYLLAISGHPNKFSRPGFLLQALAQHLHPYQAELKAAYAIDLKADSADVQARLHSLVELIRSARAIVLLAPIPKDDWSGCLKALLNRLPDQVFQYKPVLVVGSGGFIGEMHDLEGSLAADLERLAAHEPLSSVHIGIKNWVFEGDRAPSLTAGTETRLANAIRRICAETAERTPETAERARFSEAA